MAGCKIVMLAVTVAWGCSVLPARAEDTKPGSLSVQTVLPIVIDTTDPAQKLQKITVRIKPAGGPPPTVFEMLEARLSDRSTDFAQAFKFDNAQTVASQLSVPLEITLDRLPFAGTYKAKVRALQANGASSELELSFVRPAAQLAAIEDVTFEYNASSGTIVPDSIYISENSNLAFATFASPLVSGQLRGPNGEALGSRLQLAAAAPLLSGKRLALTPYSTLSLPIGTSNGTLRLESPQLSTGVDVKFKIVSRHWFGWLPITIAAFILVGLLYRKFLEDRQALDEGLVEAQRVYARLKDTADTQVELDVQRRIAAAIASLATAIRQTDSVDALRSAAIEAGKAVDTILTEAAESRKTSRAKIATLQAALGSPEGHAPAIARIIATANVQLDDILQKLDRGLARSQEAHIGKLEEGLRRTLQVALQDLDTQITTSLADVGPWPGTDIAAIAAQLCDSLKALVGIPSAEMARLVQASLNLTHEARVFFTRTVRQQSAKIVRGVVKALNVTAADPDLERVKDLLPRIDGSDPDALGEFPYRGLTKAVQSMREALANLIEAKTPPDGEAAVAQALKNGDFIAAADAAAAAAAAAAKSKLQPFGPEGTPAPAYQPASPDEAAIATDQPPPTPVLRIVAPERVRVGQIVELLAVVQHFAPPLTFNWTVEAGAIDREEREDGRYRFWPTASGTVIIRCDVAAPGNGRSVQTKIVVAPSAAELAIIDTRARLGQRELAMSVISGLFIAGTGTMIFADTFMGTWRDFLFAALWGFTADVGIGRLRSLAQPLTSRQIPGLAAPTGAAPGSRVT